MQPKSYFFLFLVFLLNFQLYSQVNESPYETDLLKDGIWVTTGLGLNVLGVLLIQDKKGLTEAEVQSLSKDDIWKIDRWAAGNYSEKANSDSYIPMFGSFALPLVLMLSENERSHSGQISVLFLESMATTGALFSITAALVQKSRPLVYNSSVPMEERMENDEQRSFYAGHTAATASASFFAAKIFNDFNPDSPLRPYVWGVAAAVPALVGYLRIRAGKHFLTDNIIGYVLGAASGILIPELHKKDNKNLQIYPSMGTNYRGMNIKSHSLSFSYNF